MFDFSPLKLLLVVVVSAILLGPDKLPQVARHVGHAWLSFKKLQTKVERDIRNAIPDLPDTGELARLARSPVSLLNELAQRHPRDGDNADPDDAPAVLTEHEEPSDASHPGLQLRKPIVNPVTNWVPPTGPFDPSLN